jgi:hypothetical protein
MWHHSKQQQTATADSADSGSQRLMYVQAGPATALESEAADVWIAQRSLPPNGALRQQRQAGRCTFLTRPFWPIMLLRTLASKKLLHWMLLNQQGQQGPVQPGHPKRC